jgi:thiol-disulfide isomerase/thioredoxin
MILVGPIRWVSSMVFAVLFGLMPHFSSAYIIARKGLTTRSFDTSRSNQYSSSSSSSSSLAYTSLTDPPLDHWALSPVGDFNSTPTTTSTTHSGTATASNNLGFVDRLRQTVLQQQVRQTKQGHVQQVTTLAEFDQAVRGGGGGGGTSTNKDQLVAVQWYAPWCRACKRTVPAFAALRSKLQSRRRTAVDAAVVDTVKGDDSVRYVAVSAQTAQGKLHAGFGIVTVPYSHIYHPTAGLVEELKLHSPTMFAAFELILQSYVQGYCPLSDSIWAETGVYAAPYVRVS